MVSKPVIVDVHAHHFSAEYAEFIARNGAAFDGGKGHGSIYSSLEPQILTDRFAMMDDAGVGRQVLSLARQPYSVDKSASVGASALNNAILSRMCAETPDRFSFWASLPLPHVPEALAEMERALALPGAVGIALQTFCLDESIAQEAFEPLYAALNERDTVIFLHPCQNGLCSPLVNAFGLTTCAGASMEDTVAALHLIVRAIPARYPRLRFIIPHFGGLLPVLLERLDGQMKQLNLTEQPSVTARGFFYDTVGWGSQAALVASTMAFGAEQLLPGSDFPVLLSAETYARTFEYIRESSLPDEVIEKILYENAPKLLGIA